MASSEQTQGEIFKAQGNEAFKAKNFPAAIEAFTKAIEAEPKKVEYYSNRSAAYCKTNQLTEALADADKCIEFDSTWGKGYARKGAVLCLMGQFAEAITVYTAGISADPTNVTLADGLASAEKGLNGKKKKKNKKKKKGGKKDAVDENEVQDYVIGIDLGTTYSCVGVWKDDGVTIIENRDGLKTLPSYVSFEKDGSRKTGHAAKNQTARNPKNTIYDVKRIIGQRYGDMGVEKDCEGFHFDVVNGEGDKPQIKVELANETKMFNAEEISAMVLTACKELAEDFLGQPVKRAVVTVPAYFNDAQRNATKAAGQIAGLDVLRMINEPTAAALSYGLDNCVQKDKAMNVLIFDLGGGTFDVSILTIENGIFTVKATGGDTRLGGEDFDNNLVDHLLVEAEKLGFPNGRTDPRTMQRLRKAAEMAKRELSLSQSTEVRLDAYLGNKDLILKVSRAKFEALQKAPFAMCLDTVKRVLKDAKLKPEAIDEIVLVGGSTRIPKLQEMLSAQFNGKALCKTLNPDEAVAYGAAVQGAILNGKRNSKTDSLLLMDVTPLSLGIETTGRVMSVVIPRNTPIPCVKTQTYTTEQNYQTKVDVSVYEGERLKSDENNLLGEFTIAGIESAKRGEPQIDVSFSIDSNGILAVTAVDQKTKSKADILISNRSRATTDEIDKMVAEAKKYQAEDQERMRKIECRNDLEQTIFDVLEAAKEVDDGKIADILTKAADKEQVWLEENYETARAADIALRRRGLSRRLESRGPK